MAVQSSRHMLAISRVDRKFELDEFMKTVLNYTLCTRRIYEGKQAHDAIGEKSVLHILFIRLNA